MRAGAIVVLLLAAGRPFDHGPAGHDVLHAAPQQHNYTPGDIEEGGRLYRINCIGCHGPEGNLVTGIDLGRNRFRRVSSDEEIVDAIMNGVPGTGMPPNAIVRLRAFNVVAYLRNMNATSGVRSVAAASGDAGRGKALFEGKGACNTCHRVRGEGSRSGPDLSEAGLMLRAIEIETSILDPDARHFDDQPAVSRGQERRHGDLGTSAEPGHVHRANARRKRRPGVDCRNPIFANQDF